MHSKKQYKINITEEDIKNGTPYEASSCPVALALKRDTDGDFHTVFEHICGRTVGIVPTPSEVMDFIKNFDRGVPVKPFSFTFEI